MRPIELLAAAEAELRDAADYYRREQSARLRLEFLLKFAKARNEIQKFPEMAAPSLAGTRCKRRTRFPYSIFYVLRPDRIVILAVAHQSRKPGYWGDRLMEMSEET